MKLFYKILCCVFSVSLLYMACKKEITDPGFLNIGPESVTLLEQPFVHTADNRMVPLNTNLDVVKVSSSEDWCKVSIVDNNGRFLRLEVYPNEGFEERVAEVTVFGPDVQAIVVSIRQWSNEPALVVAESDGIEIVDGELDFTMHITSNVDFILEIPDWISDAGDNAPYIGSKVYTFVASSITPGTREGEIKVITEDHPDLDVTISISQLQNVLHPALTDFTPASGEKGHTIVLNGSNFGTNPDLVTVHFNTLESEVLTVEDNAITVVVPRAPGTPCMIKVNILGNELEYATPFDYVPSWGLYTVTGDGNETFRGGTLAEGRLKARYISLDGNGNIFASHREAAGQRHVIRINEAEDIVESVAHFANNALNPNGTTIGPGNVVYVANDAGQGKSYYELDPANNWTPVARTITYLPEDEFPTSDAYMYRLVYNHHDNHLYGVIGHATGPVIKVNPVNQSGKVIYKYGTVNPVWYGLGFNPADGTKLYAMTNAQAVSYGPYVMDLDNAAVGFTKLNHLTTIPGNSSPSGLTNDLETSGFGNGWDLEFGPDGYLYISDHTNHIVRKVDLTAKTIETIIGVAGQAGTTDGKAEDARLNGPRGLAWNSDGTTMYIFDFGSNRLRKWTLD